MSGQYTMGTHQLMQKNLGQYQAPMQDKPSNERFRQSTFSITAAVKPRANHRYSGSVGALPTVGTAVTRPNEVRNSTDDLNKTMS